MYLLRFITCFVLLGLPAHVSSADAEESIAWLNENAKQEGVITFPSGLQYKVIKKGSGTVHPDLNTKCLWYHHATTLDGRVIFSTNEGENQLYAPEKSNGKYEALSSLDVITGWGWAMRLMVEGDKWELYIPAELGFGRLLGGLKIEVGVHDVIIITAEMVGMDREHRDGLRGCPQGTFDGCSEEDVKFLTAARSNYGSDIAAMQKATAQFNAKGGKLSSDEEKSDAMYRKAHLLLGLQREAQAELYNAMKTTTGEGDTGDEL